MRALTKATPLGADPLCAVRLVFALNGLVLASWVPHIPAVATRLALSPGALGRVLLGMAVGSFVWIPLAGASVGRVGSRVVVGMAAVCFCFAGIWPARAPSPTILMGVLVCFGAANGAMGDWSADDAARAIVWFRHQPLAAFDGRTAAELVAAGHVDAVLVHLEILRDGVYA